MRNVLKISPDDSVAVALPPLKAGDAIEVDGKAITLLDDIPAGHKVALNAMHKGEHVIKYGFPIGEAKTDIPQGSHVHVPVSYTHLDVYKRQRSRCSWVSAPAAMVT